MKRIPVVMSVLMALSLIATPCFSAGAAVQHPEEKTEQEGAPTPDDSLRITLNFPLASPLFSNCPIAEVNDELITVEDLAALFFSSHATMETQATGKITMFYAEQLKRLINVRLIIQEARNVGLDELPEIKGTIDKFAQAILIQLLKKEVGQDVTVDEKEIEIAYRETFGEWKIISLLFNKEENAKKAVKALKAGKSFEEIARAVLKEETAKGSLQGEYMRLVNLTPEVVEVVSKMKIGSVSPVIKVGAGKSVGYSLIKLEDIRIPDSAADREQARRQALSIKFGKTLHEHRDALYKKYVKLDNTLFKSLDFEAKKPGFDMFLADKRILAKIAGEEPVLVKDLAQAISAKLFHGVATAIEEKKVNVIKQDVLDKIIDKRVYQKEALLKGIDRTPQYRKMVRERESGILFGSFIQKVIAPTVKLDDDDINAYYNEHISDFTFPEMVRLRGLPFNRVKDAEAALDMLKKGADYSWIKANAKGQTDPDAEDLMNFGDTLMTSKSLPADMRKALTGAKPGDVRIATGTDGRAYILSVLEVTPVRNQPREEVVNSISQIVFDNKLEHAIEDWAEKLKQDAVVKIYIKQ